MTSECGYDSVYKREFLKLINMDCEQAVAGSSYGSSHGCNHKSSGSSHSGGSRSS